MANWQSELGIPAREQTLGRFDLLGAEEAFLSGTGVGIAPVRSLDGQAIGVKVPGPITEKIALRFSELVRSQGTPVGHIEPAHVQTMGMNPP